MTPDANTAPAAGYPPEAPFESKTFPGYRSAEGTPFTITIRPSWWLTPCELYRSNHARGLMWGCGRRDCPECVKTFAGYEWWGENGHLQMKSQTLPDEAWMRRFAATVALPTEFCYVDRGFTYLR